MGSPCLSAGWPAGWRLELGCGQRRDLRAIDAQLRSSGGSARTVDAGEVFSWPVRAFVVAGPLRSATLGRCKRAMTKISTKSPAAKRLRAKARPDRKGEIAHKDDRGPASTTACATSGHAGGMLFHPVGPCKAEVAIQTYAARYRQSRR